jgi:diguanylate cyclase (GGDEF)-like protein
MLDAMQAAQDLKPGQSTSGDTGNILQSTLELLQTITPQIGLTILLFENTESEEVKSRIFRLDQLPDPPPWVELRPPEHSAYLSSLEQLPWNSANVHDYDSKYTSAAAVPIYEPPPLSGSKIRPQEIGLLFLATGSNWSRGSALKLGTQFSRFVTQRWQAQREVDNKVHIDALTGLFNRRFFDAHFPLLLERAKRSQTPLALIVADIDLFKSVNSDHGLLVGDQVLQMVAKRLQEEVRRVDVVCRRGGEEFAIILPEAGLDAAREVITRLLNTSYALQVGEGEEAKSLKITLSFGVTVFPDNGTDEEDLHFQAEAAMFESKNNGRNRCHYWQADGPHLQQKPRAGSA